MNCTGTVLWTSAPSREENRNVCHWSLYILPITVVSPAGTQKVENSIWGLSTWQGSLRNHSRLLPMSRFTSNKSSNPFAVPFRARNVFDPAVSLVIQVPDFIFPFFWAVQFSRLMKERRGNSLLSGRIWTETWVTLVFPSLLPYTKWLQEGLVSGKRYSGECKREAVRLPILSAVVTSTKNAPLLIWR